MTLENRVAPNGTLHREKMRGLFTGNRGVIHNPDTKTLLGRRWSTNAWICCALDWKDRKRDVWGRNYKRKDGSKGPGWSELFFLDEVTALAAGHRPCHTCRRSDAVRFHEAYSAANGTSGSVDKNKLLHAERLYSRKTKPEIISSDDLAQLPDGTVVQLGTSFFAKKGNGLLPWQFGGYDAPMDKSIISNTSLILVTPRSIIGAIRSGYEPLWHPTAS